MTYGGFLRRILRGLGLLALVALAGVTVVGVLARFGDGPLGLLPGGPLRKGELSSAEGVDWSFAEGIREVELQLLAPPRSRTTCALRSPDLLLSSARLESSRALIPHGDQECSDARSYSRRFRRCRAHRQPRDKRDRSPLTKP